MRTIALVFLGISALACAACGARAEKFEGVDKVVYRYQDGSVPPQCHRSYAITVTKEEAKIVVDSYGKVISEEGIAFSEGEFDGVLDVIREAGIRKWKRLTNLEGCTGGTGEVLDMFAGEEEVFSAKVYHCAGKDGGDLRGDTVAVQGALKALFGDFEKLLEKQ